MNVIVFIAFFTECVYKESAWLFCISKLALDAAKTLVQWLTFVEIHCDISYKNF